MEEQPKETSNVARAVRQSDRKRSNPEACLGQQKHTSQKKGKKQAKQTGSKQTGVTNAQASDLIFKFAPSVSKCTMLVEELIPLLKKKKTINLAEEISHHLEEVTQVKTKLLAFARANK